MGGKTVRVVERECHLMDEQRITAIADLTRLARRAARLSNEPEARRLAARAERYWQAARLHRPGFDWYAELLGQAEASARAALEALDVPAADRGELIGSALD